MPQQALLLVAAAPLTLGQLLTRQPGWRSSPLGVRGTFHLHCTYPIGSMYGIYANIGGILMVNVTMAYMDPMGTGRNKMSLGSCCSPSKKKEVLIVPRLFPTLH